MAGDDASVRFTWPKVILFGDSLTQQGFSSHGCWASMVADYLQRKCDVYNRGFSGYTTRLCKLLLPKIINSTDAKDIIMFTIFLGANDSNDKELNPKQHVPVEEFKQNLIDTVEYLQGIGIGRDKIVIIGPPPVDEKTWAKHAKELHNLVSGKTNVLTQSYSEMARQVANQCGTEFVDLFSQMKKSDNWQSMLGDGLHLSTKGSQFVFELLKPALERCTDSLPKVFPDWKEIDFANPKECFDSL